MIDTQVFWLNPSMSKNDYVVSIKAIKISTLCQGNVWPTFTPLNIKPYLQISENKCKQNKTVSIEN